MEFLKLFLSRPNTTLRESLDVAKEVYYILIKLELIQTKLNVLRRLNGKISKICNAGQV